MCDYSLMSIPNRLAVCGGGTGCPQIQHRHSGTEIRFRDPPVKEKGLLASFKRFLNYPNNGQSVAAERSTMPYAFYVDLILDYLGLKCALFFTFALYT
jgi:hypothetical protein